MHDSGNFLIGVPHDFQIGGSADETGQGDGAARPAAGK